MNIPPRDAVVGHALASDVASGPESRLLAPHGFDIHLRRAAPALGESGDSRAELGAHAPSDVAAPPLHQGSTTPHSRRPPARAQLKSTNHAPVAERRRAQRSAISPRSDEPGNCAERPQSGTGNPSPPRHAVEPASGMAAASSRRRSVEGAGAKLPFELAPGDVPGPVDKTIAPEFSPIPQGHGISTETAPMQDDHLADAAVELPKSGSEADFAVLGSATTARGGRWRGERSPGAGGSEGLPSRTEIDATRPLAEGAHPRGSENPVIPTRSAQAVSEKKRPREWPFPGAVNRGIAGATDVRSSPPGEVEAAPATGDQVTAQREPAGAPALAPATHGHGGQDKAHPGTPPGSLARALESFGAQGSARDRPGDLIQRVDHTRLIQRIVRAFQQIGQEGGSIRLRLHPKELGSLLVELSVKDGGVSARIETETATARTLLLEHLPALRERLATYEIRLERFDVDWNRESGGHFSSTPHGHFSWDSPGGRAPHEASEVVAEREGALGEAASGPGQVIGDERVDVVV